MGEGGGGRGEGVCRMWGGRARISFYQRLPKMPGCSRYPWLGEEEGGKVGERAEGNRLCVHIQIFLFWWCKYYDFFRLCE